jgi:ABC-type glycerol-3-phosphate transport system substrate-binding protein
MNRRQWVIFILCVVMAGLFFSSLIWQRRGQSSAMTLSVINQSRWASNIERAVEEWNSKHPDKQIRLNQLIIGYPQLRNKLITAAGAGKPPDLSLLDSVWLSEFARAGHLTALDEIDSIWYEDDYQTDFFPVFRSGDTFGEHVWGVRNQTDMAVLWYRRDWLASEGLDPPKTWPDLVRLSRHFQKGLVRKRYGNSQFPLALPLGQKARETLVYQLLPLFWSNGGGVIEDGEVVLDSRRNIETLEFLRDLVHSHKIVSPEATTFEWNRAMKLLATGKVAMAFGGSYEKRMIQEVSGWDDAEFLQHVGYTLIPAGPRGNQSTTAGGMCYVVYEKSPRKRLAMEILKLAVSPTNMREFLMETYQHPPRMSLARTLDAKEHRFLAETAPYLYEAKTRPSFPEYSRLSDLLQEMIEKTVRGEIEASDAAGETAERILELVKK